MGERFFRSPARESIQNRKTIVYKENTRIDMRE